MFFYFVGIVVSFLVICLFYRIMECQRLKISEQREKKRADFWYESCKKEIARKSTESFEKQQLTSIINAYKHENALLKMRINILSYNGQKSIPDSTIDAVKYAVKKSHPDNGGNSDDFIRFKRCLDELEKLSEVKK